MRTREMTRKPFCFSSLFPFDISKLIQPGALKFQNIFKAAFTLNVVRITVQMVGKML